MKHVAAIFMVAVLGAAYVYHSNAVAQTSCSLTSGSLVAHPNGTETDLSDDIVYLIQRGVKRLVGTRREDIPAFIRSCQSEDIPPIQLDRTQALAACPTGSRVDLFGSCPLTPTCPFASSSLVADPKGTESSLSDDSIFYIDGGRRRYVGMRREGFVEFVNLCSGTDIPPVKLDRGGDLRLCPTGSSVDLTGSCPLPDAKAPACPFISGSLIADMQNTETTLADDVVYFIEAGKKRKIGARTVELPKLLASCSGAEIPPIQLDRNRRLRFCADAAALSTTRCPFAGGTPPAPANRPVVTPPVIVTSPASTAPSFVPLIISNVVAIPDIVDSSRVTFQWQTNYPASSRVIISLRGTFSACDTEAGEWCVDGVASDNFGAHQVTVEGLKPATYRYVVESVASGVRTLPIAFQKDTSLVGSITIGSEVTLPAVLQIDRTPPRAVSTVKIHEAEDERAFEIFWAPPTDADLGRIELFRSPEALERGSKIAVVGGSVERPIHEILSWVDRSAPESSWRDGVCYTVVAADAAGNTAVGVSECWKPSVIETIRLATRPRDATPPSPITGLTAVVRGADIGLSWQNPDDTDLAHLHLFQSRTLGYLGELVATFSDTPLLLIRGQTSQSVAIPEWAYGDALCYSIIPEDALGNRRDTDVSQACVTITEAREIEESFISVVAEPETKPVAVITTIDAIRTRATSEGEVEVALLVKGEAQPTVKRLVVVVQSERQEFEFPPSSDAWRKLVTARMFPGEHTTWVEGYDAQGKRIFVSNPRTIAVAPPVCSDGQDNDGDGAIDYPEDRGCAGPMGDREDVPRVLAKVFATPQAQAVSDRAFVARTKVEDVRSDPTAVGATEDVVSPVTTGSIVVPFFSVLQINRLGLLELPHLVVFLVLWLLEVLRLRPRRRRWGQVYDAVAKGALPFARVKLYLPSEKRFVSHEVANNRGEYGFPVQPHAGDYYLQVVKSGFSFPTKIVTADRDARYGPVYHGERFDVAAGSAPPHFDVPLDPWSRTAPKYFRARILNVWYRLVERFVVASPIVLLLGVLLAAIAAVIVPTTTNAVLFSVYLLLASVYFVSRKRSFEASA